MGTRGKPRKYVLGCFYADYMGYKADHCAKSCGGKKAYRLLAVNPAIENLIPSHSTLGPFLGYSSHPGSRVP